MSWHFLERWVEKANQHSTLVGKFWITFLIVCRMVIVASVGDRVYNDEQSEFKCNTLQPGCTNVCFNKFSPISHLRFWSFQILFVATPSVMFVIYSAHKSKMKKNIGKRNRASHDDDDDDGASEKHPSGGKRLNDAHFRENCTDNMLMKHEKKHISKVGSNVISQITPKQSEVRSHENYRGVLRGDVYPRSTLIQICRPVSSEDNTTYGRLSKTRRVSLHNASSQSFTSKTKRQHNKETNGNQNSNNSNNNSNGNPYVWRKPRQNHLDTNSSQVGNTQQQQAQPITHFEAGVSLTDVQERDNVSNSLAEADREMDLVCDTQAAQFGNNERTTLISTCLPPTAPPEYPGIVDCENDMAYKTWKGSARDFVRQSPVYTSEFAKNIKKATTDATKAPKQKTSTSKSKFVGPVFTLHFRWYIASVFVRLCLEAGFIVLQMLLYGLQVPELYKCHRLPCPNVVDCFISRPMEKTIFLWFMFVYSCICVLLNVCELTYLIYVYVKKQFGKRKLHDEETSPQRKRNPDYYARYPRELQSNKMRLGSHHRALDSSESLVSRTYTKCKGNQNAAKSGRKLAHKAQRTGSVILYNVSRHGVPKERVHSADCFAFMLDSEEEQDGMDFNIDRGEQNDIAEFELDQADFDNMDVDMNQNDDNGAEDGI